MAADRDGVSMRHLRKSGALGLTTMAPFSRTRWGGIADGRAQATGFFHAELIGGAWWLVDPVGGRFLSKGINTVRFDQDQIQGTERIPYAQACLRKYGSRERWREAAAQRLLTWGFNTLGGWSEEEIAGAGLSPLAITPVIDLGAAFISSRKSGTHAWLHGAVPDVFHTDFEVFARNRAIEACAARCNEPGVLGWFSDNELRWGPDWRGPDELLTIFLNEPAGSAGRDRAIGLLHERYGDFDGFNTVWKTAARSWDELAVAAPIEAPFDLRRQSMPNRGRAEGAEAAFDADCEAFAGALAERYFATTVNAIRLADPNHLVLGCRFALVPRLSVIAAAGRHLDVVSFNCYEPDPVRAIAAYEPARKPCLIGEFSFRGEDSGLPNTQGAGPRVPTQTARARAFKHYVRAALERSELVGYHWFEHADQPAEGRFDGENSNFGVVTIDDEVYGELARAMAVMNVRAEEIHSSARVEPIAAVAALT
jgi:agarase